MKLVLIHFEVHPGWQVCCDTTICKSNNLGPFTLDKLLSWCKIKTNVRSFIRIKEFALSSSLLTDLPLTVFKALSCEHYPAQYLDFSGVICHPI